MEGIIRVMFVHIMACSWGFPLCYITFGLIAGGILLFYCERTCVCVCKEGSLGTHPWPRDILCDYYYHQTPHRSVEQSTRARMVSVPVCPQWSDNLVPSAYDMDYIA